MSNNKYRIGDKFKVKTDCTIWDHGEIIECYHVEETKAWFKPRKLHLIISSANDYLVKVCRECEIDSCLTIGDRK